MELVTKEEVLKHLAQIFGAERLGTWEDGIPRGPERKIFW